MAQDKITEIFDIQAIEANIAKAISAAKSALPELEKLGQNIKANTTIGGASNNTSAANAAMVEFTKNIKDYTEAVKLATESRVNLNKVLTKELMVERVEVAQKNKQLKEEVVLTGELTGAYEKLNIQHKQAVKEYQNAAAAGKLSAQQLVVMKDKANELGQQLVKIDAGVGNYKRNVGNYSSAWNGLGMSIQQVAREVPNFAQSFQLGMLAISNNLPILNDELKRAKDNIALLKKEGKDAPSLFSQIASSVFSFQTALTVGITLVLAFSKEISKMAQDIKESLFPLSDAQKAINLYNKTLKDSNATKDVIADIERLTKTFELSKKNVELKKVALDDYNKTVGDVMGKTDSWAQAEQNLINKAPDFIRVTALKATATEAYSRAAAAEIEILQKLSETGGMESVNEFLKTGFLSVGSKGEQQALEKLMKVYEDYKKIGDSTLEEALKISNSANLNFVKQGKERVSKEIDLTNERLAAKKKELEEENLLERQRLEQRNIELKETIDNQKLDARQRIAALKEYSSNKSSLLLLDSITEQDIVSSKLEKIEEIESKSVNKRTNEEKVLLLFKKSLLTEQLRLNEEAQTKLNKKNEDIQKSETQILDQESEKQVAIILGKMKDFELAGKEANVATKDILQNQISFLEQSIKTLGLQEDEVAKVLAKIRDLKIAMLNEETKNEKKAAKDSKDIQDEKAKYIEDIAQETTQLMFTLLDAQTQKEISAAEKRSEALTAEYDLQRSAVEQANISAEEKTARKLVLDAEEAESQKKIDNEIRVLKRKQAIYDKAQALVSIATNTAVAVTKLVAETGGFGSPLIPLIIGLGAAQAATVLATPLPEYAKGKKASDSYEGLAIAGEKGTEMKIDKDGSLQLLTKPTLIHTKRGDTILSNKELMSGELGKHIKTGKEKANYDELIKAYSYHTDRTIKAIKNSPSNIIIDNSNYNLSLKRARV